MITYLTLQNFVAVYLIKENTNYDTYSTYTFLLYENVLKLRLKGKENFSFKKGQFNIQRRNG